LSWSTDAQLYKADSDRVVERFTAMLINSKMANQSLQGLKDGRNDLAVDFIQAAHDEIAQSATAVFSVESQVSKTALGDKGVLLNSVWSIVCLRWISLAPELYRDNDRILAVD
jgi:hypothetical protein